MCNSRCVSKFCCRNTLGLSEGRSQGVEGGGGGRPRLDRKGGHRVVRQPPVKPVGHGWDSGWGAGSGGYKSVAAAVGVESMRLERNWQLLLGDGGGPSPQPHSSAGLGEPPADTPHPLLSLLPYSTANLGVAGLYIPGLLRRQSGSLAPRAPRWPLLDLYSVMGWAPRY